MNECIIIKPCGQEEEDDMIGEGNLKPLSIGKDLLPLLLEQEIQFPMLRNFPIGANNV